MKRSGIFERPEISGLRVQQFFIFNFKRLDDRCTLYKLRLTSLESDSKYKYQPHSSDVLHPLQIRTNKRSTTLPMQEKLPL